MKEIVRILTDYFADDVKIAEWLVTDIPLLEGKPLDLVAKGRKEEVIEFLHKLLEMR